jgi:hypothetical protein
MRFVTAVLCLAVGLFAAPAWPCRCSGLEPQPGFLSSAPGRHLPANAKGVVFLAPLRGAFSVEGVPSSAAAKSGLKPLVLFVEALPPPPTPANFVATDVTTGTPVKVRLTPLTLGAHFPWGDLPVFTSKTKRASCRGGNTCESQLGKLYRAGAFTDVTAATVERVLVRVEPVGGFVAGHTYHFEYTPNRARVEVIIDAAPVETFAATLELEPPTFGKVTLPTGASCSDRYLAASQVLRLQVSAALEPYLDSLLLFAEHAPSGPKWPVAIRTRESICDELWWGRSVLRAGEERLALLCPRDAGVPTELHTVARADWAFLEVDAVMRSTNSREVSLSVKDACPK